MQRSAGGCRRLPLDARGLGSGGGLGGSGLGGGLGSGGGGRGGLVLGLAPEAAALGHGVGERRDDGLARLDRVVVARDHVVGLVRVAVGVDQADHRDAAAARLAHRERLAAEVDDHHRVRQLAHLRHAAEVGLELLELAQEHDALLARQQVELAVVALAAQVVQMVDAPLHRAVVRQQATEPAVVDVGHVDALGLQLHGLAGLLLGAHEEHAAAALGEVAHERVRLLDQRQRLLQVDDVDAGALAEDEPAHLRVPATCLVSEVHTGLEQLAHCDRGHGRSSDGGCGRAPAGSSDGAGERRHHRRKRVGLAGSG